MKNCVEILNDIIKSYNKNEYPEYFQDDVYEIFKREGITDIITSDAVPVVRCKDCVYYISKSDDQSTCQRLWGGMIDCTPESYCSDGLSVEDYKRKLIDRVNDVVKWQR